ncbi:MAG: LLM class flavin-dependent oxidoreductase [Pseudomonadota bacterium]
MDKQIDFGMFDWIDRGTGTISSLYQSRLALIERADKAGFYGYHLAEHHATPLGMAPSPAVFFASLIERTSQIRFSPMAYLMPLYHPLRLVEEVCMLDHLSGGRMEVGVSRGVSPYEAQSFGADPEQAQEIFEESLEIYCQAMTAPLVNHHGKHYQFKDVPMEIKPLQQPYPALWYPSFSESGASFAAQNGCHFMSLGPPSLVAKLMDHYREIAAAQGTEDKRLNGHIKVPMLAGMRQIYVANTDEEAMAIAKPAYQDWYQSITKLWHHHNDTSFDAFFEWDACLAGETILVGSVDKVRNQIAELIEVSGINYFVGSFAWGSLSHEDSMQSLELFISEIIPSLTH